MTNPEAYNRVVTAVIDVQNDFCPGGALGVEGGDEVVAPLNDVTIWTARNNGENIFTADWHPPQTKHFAEYGGPWPPHCVEDTKGADFNKNLAIHGTVIRKGQSAEDHGYSGFEAVTFDGQSGIKEVVTPKNGERVALLIGGLATDYCVKATVLDACKLADEINFPDYPHKLDVYVIEDAIRAVNLQPRDGEKAIGEMKAHGARFITSEQIVTGGLLKITKEHIGV